MKKAEKSIAREIKRRNRNEVIRKPATWSEEGERPRRKRKRNEEEMREIEGPSGIGVISVFNEKKKCFNEESEIFIRKPRNRRNQPSAYIEIFPEDNGEEEIIENEEIIETHQRNNRRKIIAAKKYRRRNRSNNHFTQKPTAKIFLRRRENRRRRIIDSMKKRKSRAEMFDTEMK